MNGITGEPLGGARVKLQSSNRNSDLTLYGRADSQGRFEFSNVATGFFSITAEKPGFMYMGGPNGGRPSQFIDLTWQQRGRAVIGGNNALTLKFEKKVDETGVLRASVTIQLVAYAVITGKVTDPDGYPLPNVPIRILMKSHVGTGPQMRPDAQILPGGQEQLVPMGSQVHTNDRGEYRVARLADGAYYVAAQGVNYSQDWDRSFRITYFPRALDVANAKPLQLTPGQQARADIQIVKQTGVKLSGKVYLPSNDAPPQGTGRGTMVYLVPVQDSGLNRNSMPAPVARDQYEIQGVLPGQYTLTAVTWEQVLGGNERPPVYAATRQVAVSNQDINGLDIELKPLSETQGTVTFEPGCTPADLRIQLMGGVTYAPPIHVNAGEDRFVVPRLAPGRFTINIRPRNNDGGYRLKSLRLGDREVQQYGFDAPAAGETLSITMGCFRMGGVR